MPEENLIMKANVSTRFHHISAPNYLLEIVERETDHMQRRHPSIRGFKVTVALSNSRHRHDREVRALVTVVLRNAILVASKEVDGMSEHDNASAALRRAFLAAEKEMSHHHHRGRFKHTRSLEPASISDRSTADMSRCSRDVRAMANSSACSR